MESGDNKIARVVSQQDASSPITTTTTNTAFHAAVGVQQSITVTNRVVCPAGATVVEITTVVVHAAAGVQQPITVTNRVVCPAGATVVEITTVVTFGPFPPVQIRRPAPIAQCPLHTDAAQQQQQVARVGPVLSKLVCIAALALLLVMVFVCRKVRKANVIT